MDFDGNPPTLTAYGVIAISNVGANKLHVFHDLKFKEVKYSQRSLCSRRKIPRQTNLAAAQDRPHTELRHPYRLIFQAEPMSVEKTETRLMNKALHYLERYSASEQRLREVLSRFATRKLLDTEPALVASAMTRVVEKCQRLGYVDDVAFAANQARSQRRQGKSTMAIRHRLRQHGIDDATITKALHNADTDQQDAELAAAIHFVKRRRLGPFFQGVANEKTLHRHMGSLARAGFSLSICRAVLDNHSIDVLDKLEREATQTGQLDE